MVEVLHSGVAGYAVVRSELPAAAQKRLQEAEIAGKGAVSDDLLVELSKKYPSAVQLVARNQLPPPDDNYEPLTPDEMKDDITDPLSALMAKLANDVVGTYGKVRHIDTEAANMEIDAMKAAATKELTARNAAAELKKSAEMTTGTMKIATGSVGVIGSGMAARNVGKAGLEIRGMKNKQNDIARLKNDRENAPEHRKAEFDTEMARLQHQSDVHKESAGQFNQSSMTLNQLNQGVGAVGTGSAETAAAEDNYHSTLKENEAQFLEKEQQWHGTSQEVYREGGRGALDAANQLLSGTKAVLDGSIEASRAIGRNV